MKTKERVEQTDRTKDKGQEASGASRGGGRLDGKAATATKTKVKDKATENIRRPT